MKQFDLGPNHYRKQDDKGRWQIPDDPKAARNMMFVMIAVLGFIHWNRDALTSDTLFWVAALFAFFAGGLFALWLKNRYL